MVALPEDEVWHASVTQIQTNEPVIGGVTGVSNRALIELGDRTAWLKQKVDAADAALAALNYVPASGGTFTGNVRIEGVGPFIQIHETDTEDNARFVMGTSVPRIEMPENKDFQFNGHGNANIAGVRIRFDGGLNWLLHKDNFEAEMPGVGASPGEVRMFAMPTPPNGWLECDGSLLNRTSYAALFAAIGTIHGAGDNVTTFGIPDLRGEFVRGWDHGRGADPGRAFGSWQAKEIQHHAHTMSTIIRSTFDNTGGSSGYGQDSPSGTGPSVPINAYQGAANETRPRNRALMYCIKF